QRLLEAECNDDPQAEQTFDIEYRREVFRCAADRVRRDVREHTWQAFWLTTMDDLPAAEVGVRLGISTGAVYIARSRVMARLRMEARSIEETRESSSPRA